MSRKPSTGLYGGRLPAAREPPRTTSWGKGAGDWLVSSLQAAAGQPLLGWLVGLKLLYLSLVVLGVGFWNDFDEERRAAIDARWFDSGSGGSPVKDVGRLARYFATWDAEHYLYLSQAGYAAGVKSCAFYPLWPLFVRWFSAGIGVNHVAAGVVLANVLSLAAWLLFYSIVRERWTASVSRWTLVFLIAFPGSLFFQFNYSESLFFFLVMGLWYGLEKRRHGVAALAAVLLPLTRAVGVFALLPIVWHALTVASPVWLGGIRPRWGGLKARRGDGRWKMEEGGPKTTESGAWNAEGGYAGTPWLLLTAPLIGWCCYLALMWHWTGNPFEGFEAQKHWSVHSIWNLIDVPKFVIAFFTPTQLHAFTGSVLDRCVFVLLLYTLPVLWRLDKGLLVWTYWLGILSAMSGTFTSYTRFASCAFPIFLALGTYLNAECGTRNAEPKAGQHSAIGTRHSAILSWLKWTLLAAFAVLHVVLVWRFVNFRWAG